MRLERLAPAMRFQKYGVDRLLRYLQACLTSQVICLATALPVAHKTQAQNKSVQGFCACSVLRKRVFIKLTGL